LIFSGLLAPLAFFVFFNRFRFISGSFDYAGHPHQEFLLSLIFRFFDLFLDGD